MTTYNNKVAHRDVIYHYLSVSFAAHLGLGGVWGLAFKKLVTPASLSNPVLFPISTPAIMENRDKITGVQSWSGQ